jgi:short-subunit dehydrogenase
MKKNIIVTGASRGIGYELVKYYASCGHRVIAISRNQVGLNSLKQDCLTENKDALVETLSFDLAQEDYSVKLFPMIIQYFTSVDILINNAGFLKVKPFSDLQTSELEQMYQVNVFSVFKMIQILLPYFSNEAHIVNISSVGGLQGSVKFSGLSGYSSSKAALVALTECLSEEYKDQSWSFNCLALGAVQTEMLAEAFPGYEAPLSAKEMADYIAEFSLHGSKFYKGKILNVSKSTP